MTPPTRPLVVIRAIARIMPMKINAESREARNPPSPFLFEITNPEIAPEIRRAVSDTVFILPVGLLVVIINPASIRVVIKRIANDKKTRKTSNWRVFWLFPNAYITL